VIPAAVDVSIVEEIEHSANCQAANRSSLSAQAGADLYAGSDARFL
jgi:hypothetical protein